MSEVSTALEAGSVAVEAAILPVKKPGFFSKLGGELGKRLAPHNVAADLILAAIVGLIGLGATGISRYVIRPWQIKSWLGQHPLPMVEAMLVAKGYATTDNQAKAMLATLFIKNPNLGTFPERYAEYRTPAGQTVQGATAQAPTNHVG